MKYLNIAFLLLISGFIIAQDPINGGFEKSRHSINATYYDTLHQILLESNLTHYRIYYRDSLLYNWQDPQCENQVSSTASLMKSITSLAVGELLENGFIRDLDEPVCNYIPEWKDGCENKVTIRHLISMTGGVLKKPWKERVKFFTTNDLNGFVLDMAADTIPGVQWSYSNEAGQLLEPIIQRASGMDVQDFFDEYIFHPLEMKDTKLYKDSAGNYCVIGGATTSLDDLSVLGKAVLNGGMQNGNQVLNKDYLNEALTPIPQNKYYGYLWWLNPDNNTYTAMGDGGTVVIIYPEKDLVFVRVNNCKTGTDPMRWMGPEYVSSIGDIIR